MQVSEQRGVCACYGGSGEFFVMGGLVNIVSYNGVVKQLGIILQALVSYCNLPTVNNITLVNK